MLPRPAVRRVADVLVVLGLVALGLVVPTPAYAEVRVLPPVVRERRLPTLDHSATVVLPITADSVAVHWLGQHEAVVTVAMSGDGLAYGTPVRVRHDEVGPDNGRTWGALLSAGDARAVRLTADRPLEDVVVVAIADDAPRVVRQPVGQRSAAAAVNAPEIRTRAEWGADETKRTGTPSFGTISKLVVHHTAGGPTGTQSTEEYIRGVYAYHTAPQPTGQGWSDIGYNFLIGADGRVFEGRWARAYLPGELHDGENSNGKGVVGAHAADNNTGSVGVSLIGNFEPVVSGGSGDAPQVMKDSLVDVLAWKAGKHGIDPTGTATWTKSGSQVTLGTIVGHRDVGATACPGGDFYAGLSAIRTAVQERLVGPGRLQAVTPKRILDTREGPLAGPVVGGSAQPLQVRGQGGVPSQGVSAVVLNVTAIDPTTAGYLTVYPDGITRPEASNVNFVAGQTVPNLVMVAVPQNGLVNIYNSGGATHVAADVVGWYDDESAPAASRLQPVVPARLLDSRLTGGAITPGESRSLTVTGAGGLPSSGVDAVLVNVTAISPTAASYLTVYPDGAGVPDTSNLNLAPRRTKPNLVLVKVGGNGVIRLYNAAGYTHVAVDVVGWHGGPSTVARGRYRPVGPARLLDTRVGTPKPLGPGGFRVIQPAGTPGIPLDASAVVLNVTAVLPTAAGYLTAYPPDASKPETSNLNFVPGDVVPNLVVVRLSGDGKVAFYNSGGSTHLVVDVMGWFTPD